MAGAKSSFLDKVLGRIGRLDAEGLQSIVQRLARERAFLETLFNTIEDGVLVLDETGRIVYFNNAVKTLFGWRGDVVEGQPIHRYLPQLDWQRITRFDAEGGKRILRHEVEIQYPQPRFLRVYAAPLDGHEIGSSGVALILHDATAARQETFEAIESERMHSLTLLAASVAHEIGNPLNALHIHLQLIGREIKKLRQTALEVPVASSSRPRGKPAMGGVSLQDETAEIAAKLENYVGVAKGEITRLDYIITQFLQAIRPTQPQLTIASLNDVARETLELLAPELENRGITIEKNLARRLSTTPIDPAQIKQALVNLVKNAMQAMTRGGMLRLETGETPDCIWISVSDTGRGISQDQINHIFEPFYTTKKKGTGLGLMIVQRIVRDHGGRIEVESRVGQGTSFRIWLPLPGRTPRLLEAQHGNGDKNETQS
jgi:two-component system, sporulation sensor kinase E